VSVLWAREGGRDGMGPADTNVSAGCTSDKFCGRGGGGSMHDCTGCVCVCVCVCWGGVSFSARGCCMWHGVLLHVAGVLLPVVPCNAA
jgi:hypothetical protein